MTRREERNKGKQRAILAAKKMAGKEGAGTVKLKKMGHLLRDKMGCLNKINVDLIREIGIVLWRTEQKEDVCE